MRPVFVAYRVLMAWRSCSEMIWPDTAGVNAMLRSATSFMALLTTSGSALLARSAFNRIASMSGPVSSTKPTAYCTSSADR